MIPSKQGEIEYQITNTDKLCGQGNINSLKTQNGYWKSYIGTDKTQLRCLFKNVYRAITCQIKIKNTDIVEFIAYLDKNEQTTEMKPLKSKQKQLQAGNKLTFKLKNQDVQIDEIFIDLHSIKKKQVQVSWLRFYGTLIRQKSQRKPKKPHSQSFKDRIKESTHKNLKQTQINQTKAQKRQVTEQQSKQAKQVKQRDNKNANIKMFIPENYDEEELIDPEELELKQNYKIVNFTEKQLKRIQDVTQEWLEGQRKMEASFGVSVQHKLSVKISPKCFTGLKFCLPNIYGEEKSKYVKIIKELGGFIREQLCQNCIVATNKPQGAIVGLAKIMEAYLDECYRLKNKVKFSKYYFTSHQYLM